jgi:hypothetical protein
VNSKRGKAEMMCYALGLRSIVAGTLATLI